MVIEKNGLAIAFAENTGVASFLLAEKDVVFTQATCENVKVFDVRLENERICYIAEINGYNFSCSYQIKEDETGRYVSFKIFSDSDFSGMVRYPAPILVQKGDRAIEAYGEGFAFNVEDDIEFPPERLLFGGSWNSMSFWSIESGQSWIMTAVIDNAYAYLITAKEC